MAEMVTLVNRSSKVLEGVWDGRRYLLKPGKHEFETIKARKFKEQHPIMGTFNKNTTFGDMKYLIGIVEDGDPIDPVEQSDSLTLEDLGDKLKTGEYKIIPGNGLYAPRSDKSPTLPQVGEGVGFAK